MSRLTVAMCVLVAVGAAGAFAQQKATGFEQFKTDRAAALGRLVAKGTPDSLAAAAVLKQFGEETDSGAYALAARAVGLAPQRRDLAWLAVRLCNSASDCDPARPEQHLRSIDPGNGVGFMGDLRRAQAGNDAAATDAALRAIGNSEHVYVYFAPLVAATAPELAMAHDRAARGPTPKDLAQATIEMIGVIAASTLPPSQAFSFSCRGMALQREGRLEQCRRAARAFERADTYIGEGLGLSLQQQLWPLDSAEGRAISARRRVFDYRLYQYSRLSISSPDAAEYPADLLDVLRANPREQDAALVYFRKAAVPADPPANWTSNTPPRVP